MGLSILMERIAYLALPDGNDILSFMFLTVLLFLSFKSKITFTVFVVLEALRTCAFRLIFAFLSDTLS